MEGITAFRVGFSALIAGGDIPPVAIALTRRDVVNLLIYGTVMGMMNLLIYRAFERIPIGIAVAIEVTGPLVVALLSSLRPRDIAACALAVFGLYLLIPLEWSALSGSILSASLTRLAPRRAGRSISCSANALRPCAAARRLPWACWWRPCLSCRLGWRMPTCRCSRRASWASGVVIAVLSSAIPYSLEILALRGLPQGLFGMFSSAAPAVSAIAGLLILGERLSGIQWFAIACIVLASAMCAMSARGTSSEPIPQI